MFVRYELLLTDCRTCRLQNSRVLFAAKELRIQNANQKTRAVIMQSYKNEMAVLKQVSHQNIVRLYGDGINTQNGNPVMYFELCDASLETFIHKKRSRGRQDEIAYKIPIHEITKLCLEISRGLKRLHANNIAHRDLKSGNILLNYGIGNSIAGVKISDFGVATKVIHKNRSTTL
jgi:serine/threonine protein kinase